MRNRAEYKEKLSRRGRRGAEIRWQRYHESIPALVYPPDLPTDCFRITVGNLINGKSHSLLFHPGSRRGRYKIDVDDKAVSGLRFMLMISKPVRQQATPLKGGSMSNEETKAVAVVDKVDNGKPTLYNPAAFDQMWRVAKLFASSDLVPTAYKGKAENCFIAIEMADRMGISPFAMLQSLVIIQGKPSMEAKLIIALVNDSGIFKDPLEYEIIGNDPYATDYKVRAFAVMAKTGKTCHGPWITYQMVKGEGWLDKGGSKWKTMPSIMFMYRAASFFAKVYCPNITMGMQTREEMEDISLKPIDITPHREAPPMIVAPTEEVKARPPITVAPVAPPPLVTPLAETLIVEAEVVDPTTGEIPMTLAESATEEKEKRTRRTKAEMEAAKGAAVVEGPSIPVETIIEEPPRPADLDSDDDFPPPPGQNSPQITGDLF